MIRLGLKDLSHNYTRGYGMSFVIYPHLMLLINDQTFEATIGLQNFWDLNKSLGHIKGENKRRMYPQGLFVNRLQLKLLLILNSERMNKKKVRMQLRAMD